MTVSRQMVQPLLALMADRGCVLHGPDEADPFASGRDVDCALAGLDPRWSLRLDAGWRLCQVLHYEVYGHYWILERNGELLALDTIADTHGLGRYGLPTDLVFDGRPDPPSTAVRAAYLTVKRLSKGIRGEAAWGLVTGMARQDPDSYRQVLAAMIGPSLTPRLAEEVLARRIPEPALAVQALRALNRHRLRTPGRVAELAVVGARRWLERVVHPTGLVVLIAGPDGTGKSTVASLLIEQAGGLFRRKLNVHWRPGLLPRPGRLVAREAADSTRPHALAPHGRILSLMLLGYYWMDVVAGGWLKVSTVRTRTGLVLLERGWWDLAVDPHRYRLHVPPLLVRVLGRLVPRPDLALLLEAPAEAVTARKAELAPSELNRQVAAWRSVLPTRVRRLSLNAAEPAAVVTANAREAIIELLESRTASRIGAGWVGLPDRREPRWWLPRGPAAVAHRGLEVYHPVTRPGRAGWTAARLLAGRGGFRLTRRGPAPPREVRALLAPYLPRGASVAVARANHPGRFIALVSGIDGTALLVAKIALEPEGWAAVERDGDALKRLGELLPAPLRAPDVLARSKGLLLLQAVVWRARPRPWELPVEVATALGKFFRISGASHGDFAPWNLLHDPAGPWTLIDWESAHSLGAPFEDVFHYLVQAHTLLGRPSAPTLLGAATGEGGQVGESVRAYAAAAGLDLADAPAAFATYLDASLARLDPDVQQRAAMVRRRLRAALR